jgi:tight adherence protein B
MFGPNLIPALLTFAAVLFATIAIAFGLEGLSEWRRARKVRSRLDPLRRGEEKKASSGARSQLLAETQQEGSVLGALLTRLPHFRDIALKLEQADLQWTVSSYAALSLGFALAPGLGALMLSRSWVTAVFVAVMGFMTPRLYVALRRRRRLAAFEEGFPESIDLMTRAIRAGHPLSSGLQMVADEGPPTVAQEFRRVFEEHRFGLPFEDALMGLADRVELSDVRIFVTAVLVQRETGGNLAEILEKIAQTVRQRFQLRRQLRVYTAQGRLTGYVLAVMPFFMAGVMFLLNPDYIRVLGEELLGRALVVVALVFQLVGFLWIRKIVDIEM